MPKKVNNTICRNGVYQFKKRVPKDLRGHAAFGGREFYQRSLGTSDRNEAIKLAAQHLSEFEKRCALARGSYTPKKSRPPKAPPPEVTDELLHYLARQHRDFIVRQDAQTRRAAGLEDADGLTRQYLEAHDAFDDPKLIERHKKLIARDPSATRPQAIAALRREGVEDPERHLKLNYFCDLLIEAERDAADAIKKHIKSGEFEPEPKSKKLRNAPQLHPTTAGTSLETVLDSYLKVANCSEDWRKKVRRAVESFEVSQGPTLVENITRKQITDWVQEELQSLAYATQKGANATKRISPNTVRDGSLAALKRVLTHAVDTSVIDTNPAANVRVPKSAVSGKRRRPFEGVELNKLFQLPAFKGCSMPSRPNTPGITRLDDHRFWAPLVAMYTGARASEIAQIRLKDISIEDGIPFIRIIVDDDDPDASLKTSAAYRKVPIHSKLRELGFDEYIAARRKAKDERLFPDWEKASNGRYSDARCQRNFNEVMCSIVRSHDPKPTFHSFRHNVKTAMAENGVSPQMQNFLLGHEQQGQDRNYLHEPSIKRLSEAVEAIDYPGVDLSHLIPKLAKRKTATQNSKS